MAGMAEQADRYEDMAEYMKRVATMGAEMSSEERNLLSAAYKGCVGARRQSWRALGGLDTNPDVGVLVSNYRLVIQQELTDKCNEILDLLAKELVPKATDVEAQVFYLKMQGDYFRYLAELSLPGQPEREQRAQAAHNAYQQAIGIADQSLAVGSALRLGLALNLAVFFNEVFNAPDKACQLAKKTLDTAMPQLDENRKEDQEGLGILRLLHDNYQLWVSSMDGGKGLEQDGTTMEDL